MGKKKKKDFEKGLGNLSKDIETLMKAPVGSRRVKLTDLTPREGQQTKLATRVATEDLLPLCELLDKCGFYAVEMWGGATFDTCIRYIKEDPWERLRAIKKVMPKTKLQMLLRGQHILGYHPRPGPGRTSSGILCMAVLAGVHMIDSALPALAFGRSPPATESMVAML